MSNILDEERTFSELKTDFKLNSYYNYTSSDLSEEKFKKEILTLKYGIDSINSFDTMGFYYNNPLILSIKFKNKNLVKFCLNNGSASRGYKKYPGLPLYTIIKIIYDEYNQKNFDYSLIEIFESLLNFGARFDDFIVNLFWFKFDKILDLSEINNNITITNEFKKNPFKLNKYLEYLDESTNQLSFCFDKTKMIENFSKKYLEKKKNNSLQRFFFRYYI